MTSKTRVRRVARESFGYEQLRPGQEAAINSLLAGRDTLAVMPTGSGKSAIYQIAGLQMPGSTVVVSPLVALQRDQLENLKDQDVAEAAVMNSSLRTVERREVLQKMRSGDLEYLLLAPEQFRNQEVIEHLRQSPPSLFVVDEAHCVSEWGHDFRPDYLRLGHVIKQLNHPRVLALTATASPPVRAEIIQRLGMVEPEVVVQGFDRPNIWLGVERYDDEAAKKRALVEETIEADKPGIIYTATRQRAEEIAAALAEAGLRAAAYHAGMKTVEREAVQNDFMDDRVEVIVATTAFGMGIDKPNVRFVFHYDISDSVDSYYQEIGRAGRDGEPAQALLFYRPEDLGIRRFFAGGGQVDTDQVLQVAAALIKHEAPLSIQDLRDCTEMSQSRLVTALSRLEEAGIVKVLPDEMVALDHTDLDLMQAAEVAERAQEKRQQFDRSRTEMMKGYAELRPCRRQYLLNYFGEQLKDPCGYCDNCEQNEAEPPPDRPASAAAEGEFPINSRVRHTTWGEGEVIRYEADKIVVLFNDVGYKTLALDIVSSRGLLHRLA